MVVIKVKRDTNGGEKYLKNAVNYVGDGRAVEVKGYGVDPYNTKNTYNQMMTVKKYFGKTGDNPVMHFIISYDQNVQDANTACKYTKQITDYFSGNYQMITAVHRENQGGSQYHAHIIMNSVNLNDGKLYHSGITELKQLAMHVHEVTGNYCSIKFE